ncbi:hypothetical protein AWB71_02571 [Caballeronia peredens]|nr:hypothetical protein AWB71_02571 [Caballeronia peredens]
MDKQQYIQYTSHIYVDEGCGREDCDTGWDPEHDYNDVVVSNCHVSWILRDEIAEIKMQLKTGRKFDSTMSFRFTEHRFDRVLLRTAVEHSGYVINENVDTFCLGIWHQHSLYENHMTAKLLLELYFLAGGDPDLFIESIVGLPAIEEYSHTIRSFLHWLYTEFDEFQMMTGVLKWTVTSKDNNFAGAAPTLIGVISQALHALIWHRCFEVFAINGRIHVHFNILDEWRNDCGGWDRKYEIEGTHQAVEQLFEEIMRDVVYHNDEKFKIEYQEHTLASDEDDTDD